MNDLPRPGRGLVIVERGENILRITAIDPIALTVQHIDIHEMGPGIGLTMGAQTAALSEHFSPALYLRVHPNFVRVHRALREWMAEPERTQDDFEQITLTAFKFRHLWPQRRGQRIVDRASLLDSKNVHAQ